MRTTAGHIGGHSTQSSETRIIEAAKSDSAAEVTMAVKTNQTYLNLFHPNLSFYPVLNPNACIPHLSFSHFSFNQSHPQFPIDLPSYLIIVSSRQHVWKYTTYSLLAMLYY